MKSVRLKNYGKINKDKVISFSWNNKNEIFRVKGGDHAFSSKHPWKSKDLPNELNIVVKKTIDFIIGN